MVSPDVPIYRPWIGHARAGHLSPRQRRPGLNMWEVVRSNTASGRVFRGVAANALGKLWVFAYQFLSIPVLVTKWGVAGYGIWLMLSAVPTYAVLSDFGFGAAARVDMTRRAERGDHAGALNAFQSVWAFVSAISLFLLLAGTSVWLYCRGVGWLDGNRREILDAGYYLFLYSLIVVQMSVLTVAYQSVGRYAQGTFLFDILSPFEGVALIIIAWKGGYFVAASLAMLGLRLVGFAIYYRALRRAEPWITLGWRHATMAELKALAKPALAAFTFPLSTALNIQGIFFLIGLVISPAATAMFGTVRMISRVPLQLVGLLSRATLPEITMAHARDDVRRMDRLVFANLGAVAVVSLPVAMLMALLGQWVVELLTRGQIQPPISLVLTMAGITVLQSYWNTIATFLFALNLQERFSIMYLVLSSIAIALSYYLVSIWGILSVALLMLAVDVIMAIRVTLAWHQVTHSSWSTIIEIARQAPADLRLLWARYLRRAPQ